MAFLLVMSKAKGVATGVVNEGAQNQSWRPKQQDEIHYPDCGKEGFQRLKEVDVQNVCERGNSKD